MLNISEHTVTPLSIKSPRELELEWKNSEWRKMSKPFRPCASRMYIMLQRMPSFSKSVFGRCHPQRSESMEVIRSLGVEGRLAKCRLRSVEPCWKHPVVRSGNVEEESEKWKNWTIDVRCPRKDHNHKVPSSCNKIKNMEKYETIIKD